MNLKALIIVSAKWERCGEPNVGANLMFALELKTFANKNNSTAVWFDILNDFNYVDYVEIAVSYYDALYDYNKYHNSVENHEGDQNKTIEDARERLLKRTNFR